MPMVKDDGTGPHEAAAAANAAESWTCAIGIGWVGETAGWV